MILYHGTSTANLPFILKEGLQPRAVTKQSSNWNGSLASKPELVYLTTAYPVYFACAACEKPEDKPVVVKVEVRESQLFPDEDFLSYVAKKNVSVRSLNPLDNKRFGRISLLANGVAAVKSVRPSNILNHIVLDMDARLLWIGGDAAPIPMNYRILGETYQRCVEELFISGIEGAVAIAQQRNSI